MLYRIRAASFILFFGSIMTLGVLLLAFRNPGSMNFLSPTGAMAILVVMRTTLVTLCSGLGLMAGVSMDISKKENSLKDSKKSASKWWVAGLILGTLGGLEFMSRVTG
jgi:hypothetical protein